MNVRNFALVSSILFLLIALLQLFRLVMQWDVTIAGWHLPMWASIVAVLVAGALSFAGFRLSQDQRGFLSR